MRPPLLPAAIARLRERTDASGPDCDLLAAFAAGRDQAAFATLVRRHGPLVWAVACRHAADPHAAEDAFQATFLTLARLAGRLAGPRPLAGWLHTVAVRFARKTRRFARRHRQAAVREPADPRSPLDELTARELLAIADDEIHRLPDRYRLPIVLCGLAGLARDEAAAELGWSFDALKGRLERGRELLRRRLAARGVTLPAAFGAALLVLESVPAELRAATVRAAIRFAAGPVPGRAATLATGMARPVGWAGYGWAIATATVALGLGLGLAGGLGGPGDSPVPPTRPPQAPSASADRYGDPLPDGALLRLGTVRFRHGNRLNCVAYTPDGKTIASGGFGRIMLWEADTGKPLGSLVRTVSAPPAPGRLLESQPEHGHTFGLAFTPDGKRLLSAGSPSAGRDRGHVVFWDLGERRWKQAVEHLEARGTHWMRAVAVSPDGRTAAAGTDAGDLLLLDANTQKTIATAKTDGVAGLSFAPDGKTLAVANYHRVVLLNAANGTEVNRLEAGRARQVVFAPDGKSVWGGGGGEPVFGNKEEPATIRRWDLGTGTAVQTFETGPGMLLALALSPDGKTLASGGMGIGPTLWDTTTGKATDLDSPARRLRPTVSGLAFAPDGKTLAVADSNGRVRVWDLAARRELHRDDEHTSAVLKVAVSPDGTRAATAGGDGTVRVWDLAAGRGLRSWTADQQGSAFAAAFTPDGRSLLTCGWSGTLRLWDAATGAEVRRFRDEKVFVRVAALSPDGTLVAASGPGGMSIILQETATGRTVRELTGHTSFLAGLTFTTDGRRLVSSADMHNTGRQTVEDLSVRVWDVATGQQVQKLETLRPRGPLAVSPDGRVVAAAGSTKDEDGQSVRFWDVVTGKEVEDRRMKGIEAVAFSPDGRLVAVADRDVRLIEVASGRVVQTFETGAGTVTGLTFTRDGRRLISAHDDGTALVWDLTPRPMVGTDRTKWWDELASDDAPAARRAAGALAADPAGAVALFGEKVKPVPKPTGARPTAALVAELNAPAFAAREAASRELVRRVATDFDELTAARTKATSEEVRQRLSAVLRAAPGPWPRLTADDLRMVRAVGVLEAVGTPEAKRLLRALADGDPYARLTRDVRAALGRLGN